MKKSRTRKAAVQVEAEEGRMVSVQMPLPMLAALDDIRLGFEGLCIEAGRQVLWMAAGTRVNLANSA